MRCILVSDLNVDFVKYGKPAAVGSVALNRGLH